MATRSKRRGSDSRRRSPRPPRERHGGGRARRTVIAPDGVLVLNNHLNRRSITGLRHQLRNVMQGRPGGSPTDRNMASLLERCGFRIVEAHGFAIIPPWREVPGFPSTPLLKLEQFLGRRTTLQRFAKDRIYVCRPILEDR